MGDVWCVVVRQSDDSLVTYLLSPKQIRDGAHQDGNGSWWVEPKKYDLPKFREKWDRYFPVQREKAELPESL